MIKKAKNRLYVSSKSEEYVFLILRIYRGCNYLFVILTKVKTLWVFKKKKLSLHFLSINIVNIFISGQTIVITLIKERQQTSPSPTKEKVRKASRLEERSSAIRVLPGICGKCTCQLSNFSQSQIEETHTRFTHDRVFFPSVY